jgi:tRNA threonylcarbamoyladenosine biosynthesis protein TsaE
VDAYRIRDVDEFEELGIVERLSEGDVVVVEWADKIIPGLPEARIEVVIEETSSDDRRISITFSDARAI